MKAQGQELMEGVMGNIVKGGNQSASPVDDDDYDTSNSKGQVKSVKKALKNHKVTEKDLPESYDFDWQYHAEMTMTSRKKESIDMTFLIKKGADYQATLMVDSKSKDMGNSIMLFDSNLNAMVMFMEAQGQKFMQIHPIPEHKQSNDIKDYKITKIPSKTILNYNCKGLQIEDDRYIVKMFHTTEAPVKLSHFMSFSGNKNMDIPDIDPSVISQLSDGLIMEMQMIDKKKSKNNVTITAKSLGNEPKQIVTSDYKVMDLFSGTRFLKN